MIVFGYVGAENALEDALGANNAGKSAILASFFLAAKVQFLPFTFARAQLLLCYADVEVKFDWMQSIMRIGVCASRFIMHPCHAAVY